MSYKHILVAVDLSDSSKAVIDKAINQASVSDSQLSLVYVDVDRIILEPKKEQELHKKLQELAEQCGYPVSDIMVVNGDLHVKLKGIVKQSNIDLVVCGHHHNLLSRLFSAIPKVANAVEADMLVVYLNDE